MINTTPKPYEASVLADSICAKTKVRLTTLAVTFPRFILAEFNTHRVFSRCSASSRAIPVKKRIDEVRRNPYIPLQFGQNQRGMQASDNEVINASQAKTEWLKARDAACDSAEQLAKIGLHKQWANRLLEPFAWHTVIVTSTEWDNYFALRIAEDAQPEICKASISMKNAMNASAPRSLATGEWHTPLIFEEDYELASLLNLEEKLEITLAKVSVARCARISYLTHDGKRDLSKDIELYTKLVEAGHMSPLEHAAMVNTLNNKFIGNFRAPWIQFRKMIPGEAIHKS